MSNIKTLRVIEDTGSQEVALLVESTNHLLQTLGDLVTTLKSAVNIGDVVAAATTAESALQLSTYKLKREPGTVLNPLRPSF